MSTVQDTIRAYRQRTKHQLQRYAAGPDTLDWDAQPDPFRSWQGAPLTMLPLVADTLKPSWADLFEPGKVAPQSLTLKALGALLELSLGLTAWKQYGPDRWALRANPSSGNLHPTEAYVLVCGVAGLTDGLYHYAPREHALALRASLKAEVAATLAPQMWLGLSSVQWREAWKYGERAFRYCQLDTGHAVGGLRYAAAVLGWQAAAVSGLTHAALGGLLGLDRDADFGTAEREEPEVLMHVGPASEPRVHAVFFVHRVGGLTPGAYILQRSPSVAATLKSTISTGSEWLDVACAPASVPLKCLIEHPGLSGTLRTLSCHQAIGRDACFAVSMLAEFDDVIDVAPATYRELYQEAGSIGQVLYLQAEAEGYRGTGIGCYFDDAVHELLGIKTQKLQALYHFAVGVPGDDTRISTERPYPGHPPASELD